MSALTWASTCKHVIKDLRSNEGYVDVYVNYTAIFMYSGERCMKIFVWVPPISANAEQNACACFIRSSVIPLDTPHEYIDYYKKIMIYPKSTNQMMVFAYNEKLQSYSLLEIYSNKFWTEYRSTPIKTVIMVIPQSYGEILNLQTFLNPIFLQLTHYRYVQNLYYIFKLCISEYINL